MIITKNLHERQVANEVTIRQACQKTPAIAMGQLLFNNERYPVNTCGEGKEHFVHAFSEKKIIVINGSELATENLILKRYHHNIKPKTLPRVMKEEIKAYQALSERGIPVPICYANPQNIVDPANERNGGFWILEKMSTPVEAGTTELKVLKQAREFFNLNAFSIFAGAGEVINDLRPPNVMLNNDGKMHVVDFSAPLTDNEMARYNLNQNLIRWADGNQQIFNYLIAGFPEELRNVLSMTNPITIDEDSF